MWETYVFFIFLPVLIIVYVPFLPFAFSEIERDQSFVRRSSITWEESGLLVAGAEKMPHRHGTEEKSGLQGSHV